MNPFKIDGPTCISFSFGRSSALMLARILEANGGLPSDALVLSCNTGKEDPASLDFGADVSNRWGVPITLLEYRIGGNFEVMSFDTASRNGRPFQEVIRQRGGILPNPRARYCSSEMKTRTMHRYLRSIGWTGWDTMIGIRADEPRRVAKFRANPHPETPAESVRIPLADAGVSAHDVRDFWKAQPFDLRLPNIDGKTMHGNCDLCFLKPAAQVLSLIQESPCRAVWWAFEEKKAEEVARGSGARFRDDRATYQQMMTFSQAQRDAFDPDEEAISCFCGD